MGVHEELCDVLSNSFPVLASWLSNNRSPVIGSVPIGATYAKEILQPESECERLPYNPSIIMVEAGAQYWSLQLSRLSTELNLTNIRTLQGVPRSPESIRKAPWHFKSKLILSSSKCFDNGALEPWNTTNGRAYQHYSGINTPCAFLWLYPTFMNMILTRHF
jgi:hypothetical protein